MQALIAALVLAYGVSTLAVHRPPSGYTTIWDGWVYTFAEALPVIPCLMCVRREPGLRVAWVAMSLRILLYTTGDLVWSYHDQNEHPIPSPAVSDIFYLLAYAAFIVAIVAFVREPFRRAQASARLDALIAGVTAAAVSAMLWLEPVLVVSGRPLAAAVNIAYPCSDLALLVLLVSGLSVQRRVPGLRPCLLMASIAWFVVGDLIWLNLSATNSYVAGTPLDVTWLIGLYLGGLAATVRPPRPWRVPAGSPSSLAVVPVGSGLVSLAVIVVSLLRGDPVVVPLLAVCALVLVIGRMGMTLRAVNESTQSNFRDARTDYLTGLPNRRAFLDRVATACLDDPSGAGVLLIDLDGFKEVNDALGHASGDELLKLVGGRFVRELAGRGALTRLGGDEYACICEGVGESELVAIGKALRDSLREPCVLDGVSVRVGASIGVAMAADGHPVAADLLRCADVAMYEAKRARSHVAVYRPELDPHNRERLEFLGCLRQAVDNRSLTLHYQPTLDMRTLRPLGVEALVRWEHPELGLLYPGSFIPLAERVGLLPDITRSVVDQAVSHAASLTRAGRYLQMSVNISRFDLVDEELPSYIDDVLARNAFPPERLTLEITESALSADQERAVRCVRDLRDKGIRISVDDYGVGYSSMSQLLVLEIDELKIDRSFVTGLRSGTRAQAIVRSAVELARALGVTVVAEGIETRAVFDLLRDLGADIGQGYLIGRPMAPRRLEEYLAAPLRLPGAVPMPLEPAVPAGVAEKVAVADLSASAPHPAPHPADPAGTDPSGTDAGGLSGALLGQGRAQGR
ncbi:MAG TPA: EAL domain-containing protein [Acidimicrobiales bacterium]|nr:EAL domain-containing protein [Acidimicrobiales bacterium]